MSALHSLCPQINIRIDDQGVAKMAGFASATLSNIASEDDDLPVKPRWCSPEIIHPDAFGLTKAKATKASDMYAFGMLAYEVGSSSHVVPRPYSTCTQIFSGRIPFHDMHGAAVVIAVITTNERPPRPDHQELSDQLWKMIEKCWRMDPSQRSTIQEAVAFLEDKDRNVNLQMYD